MNFEDSPAAEKSIKRTRMERHSKMEDVACSQKKMWGIFEIPHITTTNELTYLPSDWPLFLRALASFPVMIVIVSDRADGGERAGIDSRSIGAPICVGEL